MMGRPENPDPWRVPVAVLQVPEGGLHRELDADDAVRKAMADIAGVREGCRRMPFDDAEEGGRFCRRKRSRAHWSDLW